MENSTVAFLGHRSIVVTEKLKNKLYDTLEDLVKNKGYDTFLFGSRSEFIDLCYEIVSTLKEKYRNIKRVYVRAEYLNISDNYKSYLLQSYEDTFFSQKALGARRAVYIQRNYEMIDKSDCCIFYYDEANQNKSGTKIAFNYALKKGKHIVNVYKI